MDEVDQDITAVVQLADPECDHRAAVDDQADLLAEDVLVAAVDPAVAVVPVAADHDNWEHRHRLVKQTALEKVLAFMPGPF